MNVIWRRFALATLLCFGACRPDGGLAGPDVVPQRAEVLYESELWTKPEGGNFGSGACRARRGLPGCEQFRQPVVKASATDGNRLVVVMQRDLREEPVAWDILISDDLGKTVRRFGVEGLASNGRAARLYLFQGRIFLLASFTDPTLFTVDNARVFEIDPVQGSLTPRGGQTAMSDTLGAATSSGALTAVSFGRAAAPQVVSVTRFDPTTNSIQRDDLRCTVAGCDPASLASPFLSDDGETFHLLVSPATGGANPCLLTVHAAARTVESQCFPGLSTGDSAPVSSFGGTAYDFRLGNSETETWLAPVARQWLPSGERIVFGKQQLQWAGGHFILFSASAFTSDGDTRLARVLPGGSLQTTVVQHEGCLNLGPFLSPGNCPLAVVFHPLAGDEVLLITQQDEFDDETRSRQLFKIVLSTSPFEAR
jgi:hypothetical protein